MKNIYSIITVITLALLLSACSDGKGSFDTGESKVDINITVEENDLLVNDEIPTEIKIIDDVSSDGQGSLDTRQSKIDVTMCETYITLQENDLLVKDEAPTEIKIIHDVNGTKQICVLLGSAHILREAN